MTIAAGSQALASDVVPSTSTAVSADVRNSNPAAKTTTSVPYVKLKEILINEDISAVRVSFYLVTDTFGQWAYGKVYKNGAPIGAQHLANDGGATFTDDIGAVVAGNLIQIYGHSSDGVSIATISDMKLCYIKKLTVLFTLTLTTPIATNWAASVTNQDP